MGKLLGCLLFFMAFNPPYWISIWFSKGEENQARDHFSNSLKKIKNVKQNLFLPYPLPKDKESTQVLCIHLKKAHVIFSFLLNVCMKEIHCKKESKSTKS